MDYGVAALLVIGPAVVAFLMLWIDEIVGRRIGWLVLLAGALVQLGKAPLALLLTFVVITLVMYMAALAWMARRARRIR